MASSTIEQWSTAQFTPHDIVSKYKLPIQVLGALHHVNSKIPQIQNEIFNLEATICVDQVTARVEDMQRTSGDNDPIIINIPQRYSGLFKVVTDSKSPNHETSRRLEGVKDILLTMPKYVKVIRPAKNIPKAALITLKKGDLLEVNDTCKRATRNGVVDFVRCTVNSRTIVLSPEWNGVYQTLNKDEIEYTIAELLEHFPLPITVTPVLQKNSKTLVGSLPNNGKSSHLVITSKTKTDFVVGSDLDYKMGLIMTKKVDLNFHILSSASPSSKLEQRSQTTTKLKCEPRMGAIICGLKETLILLKPWAHVYHGIPPKIPLHQIAARRPPPVDTHDLSPSGVFALVDGVMTKKKPDTVYISRPIIPKDVPKPPPRPIAAKVSHHKSKVTQLKSWPSLADQSANSHSLPNLQNHVMLEVDQVHLDRYGYLKLEGEEISSEDNSDAEESDDGNHEDEKRNEKSTVNGSSQLRYHRPLRANDHRTTDVSSHSRQVQYHRSHSTPDLLNDARSSSSSSDEDDDYHDYNEIVDEEEDESVNYVRLDGGFLKSDSGNAASPSTAILPQISVSESERGMFQMDEDLSISPETPVERQTPVSQNQPELDMKNAPNHNYHQQNKMADTSYLQPISPKSGHPEVLKEEHSDIGGRDDEDENVYENVNDDDGEYVVVLPKDVVNLPVSKDTTVFSNTSPHGVTTTTHDESEDESDDEREYYNDVSDLRKLAGIDRGNHVESNLKKPDKGSNVLYLPANDAIGGLSVDEVVKTLQTLRIPETVQTRFREEQVDGQILRDMDESIMQEEFGMKPFYAMKLKKFIDGWRPNLK